MNILVACEESQTVTIELRKLGHRAFSADIQECSGGYPEWHINADVLPLLNGRCSFTTSDNTKHTVADKWDMIIAFPPCTDLAVSGARHFKRKQADGSQQRSIEFFMKFVNADCGKIAIENPVGIMSTHYRKPNQIIHPWQFGDDYSKSTCLWLKGLPLLVPSVTKQPLLEWHEWIDKNGKKKRQPKWFYDALVNSKTREERSRIRSKTFPGIAKAMATQWAKED